MAHLPPIRELELETETEDSDYRNSFSSASTNDDSEPRSPVTYGIPASNGGDPTTNHRLALFRQLGFFGDSRQLALLHAQNRARHPRRHRRRLKQRRRSYSWRPAEEADIFGESDDLVPKENMDYVATMMYGRYTRDLGEFAKQEAHRQKLAEKRRRKEEKLRQKELGSKRRGRVASAITKALAIVWKQTFARLGEDWVFLAILGLSMAIVSFAMDYGIAMCNKARLWLYRDLSKHPSIQFLAWISLPVTLVLFSAGFTHIVAPQAIGSGIPEMKTILRGVVLKEYLTVRAFVAKVVGLTAALGSGMPLGKEGPFVHVASIMGTLLSKLLTSFHRLYENENRNHEMLAAACAVGVACCFAAPVGGVLFSIEVTTTYFAVRNYWRGFFAAVCGATVFRLLAVWFHNEDTLTPVFKTHFPLEYPYDPVELLFFAIIGALCGIGGAAFVWGHRKYVLFMRHSKRLSRFLQKNRFVYPFLVSLTIAAIYFPPGAGQFICADLSTHDQVESLFGNFTWTSNKLAISQRAVVNHWLTPYTGIFANLAIFTVITFITSIVACTLPVPSGTVIPTFKMGAALGRLIGETMALWFPYGIGGTEILPGGYAVVGAAAFSGGMTHTISISVIVFEMTGQITHLVPVMIAVLIANAVASLLQPSMYDSIILIKRLPYLPDILPSNSGAYDVHVEDFMVRTVAFIWSGMSFRELKDVLRSHKHLHNFPLTNSPDTMILLGSIQRLELVKSIERHIGRERRLQVAARWQREAKARAREELEIRKREEELFLMRQRRPSRFEVVPAPDVLRLRELGQSDGSAPNVTIIGDGSPTIGRMLSPSMPKKSILKKTNSFSMRSFSPLYSPFHSQYSTVTGAESRVRLAFETIFRKSTTLQDVNPDPTTPNGEPSTPQTGKKVQLPHERVIDMSPDEQKAWEEEELGRPVSFDRIRIDPSPHQLVEKTSLLKVHSLFSLLGVGLAYVTYTGRLVGVVALKELRQAIEDCNSGALPKPPESSSPTMNKPMTIPVVIVGDADTEMSPMQAFSLSSVTSVESGQSYADDEPERINGTTNSNKDNQRS